MNTNIILTWRHILEEYGDEIEYFQGRNNIVADALSQLPNNENQNRTDNSKYVIEAMSELN